MTTVSFFKTDEQIDKALEDIRKKGVSFQNLVHKTGCSILRRWHADGNVGKAVRDINRLVEAMPGASRVNALRAWVETFAGFIFNTEDKVFVYDSKRTKIAADAVKGAIAEPFWQFKPEPEYKPLDLHKALAALVKKAEDRRKAGLKDGDNIPADELAKLKAML